MRTENRYRYSRLVSLPCAAQLSQWCVRSLSLQTRKMASFGGMLMIIGMLVVAHAGWSTVQCRCAYTRAHSCILVIIIAAMHARTPQTCTQQLTTSLCRPSLAPSEIVDKSLAKSAGRADVMVPPIDVRHVPVRPHACVLASLLHGFTSSPPCYHLCPTYRTTLSRTRRFLAGTGCHRGDRRIHSGVRWCAACSWRTQTNPCDRSDGEQNAGYGQLAARV